MASESEAAAAVAAAAEEETGDSMAKMLFSISQVWRAIVADADDDVDASIASSCDSTLSETLSLPNLGQFRCRLAIQSKSSFFLDLPVLIPQALRKFLELRIQIS